MPHGGTVPRMSQLLCPMCVSPLRRYRRNGVTIDRCTGCRGVYGHDRPHNTCEGESFQSDLLDF
jgi:Transcription factor zinc-finger